MMIFLASLSVSQAPGEFLEHLILHRSFPLFFFFKVEGVPDSHAVVVKEDSVNTKSP